MTRKQEAFNAWDRRNGSGGNYDNTNEVVMAFDAGWDARSKVVAKDIVDALIAVNYLPKNFRIEAEAIVKEALRY